MQLVAVDWFKDTKRIDHVAKRKGCVAQVQTCSSFLQAACYLLRLEAVVLKHHMFCNWLDFIDCP